MSYANQPSLQFGVEGVHSNKIDQAYHTTAWSSASGKPDYIGTYSNTVPSTAGNYNSFTKHYKEITFDTLKERHDNFSFEKVLKTKNEVYNTMHFQGIKEHNPNLILFMKQGVE